jgi:hypothetical protein
MGWVLGLSLLGGPALAGDEGQPMPKIKVDLPPSPEFKQSDVPEKHPDGTWSVHGLRRKLEKNLEQDVEVKGYLVAAYVCPPERANCKKGQVCKPCDQPHFFVGDKKDTKKERSMLVANYPIKPKPPKLPEIGTELVVKGKFKREAGGFAASDGLLDHTQTKAGDKVVIDGNVFQGAAEELQKKIDGKGGKAPKKGR